MDCHFCGLINDVYLSVVMAHTLRTQGEILKSMIPLRRIGSPEDIVGAAIFLASRAGAYVNGATIALDGGQSVGMRSMSPLAKL